MKAKPIIFDGESVRAILENRKTLTRRVIKPQPESDLYWNAVVVGGNGGWTDRHGDSWSCPHGEPSDRLWVRETWGAVSPHEDLAPLEECTIEYRADKPNDPYPGGWPAEEAREYPDAPRWQSPIHMPRWASRITLQITDVRVERLQEITDDDALAEGVDRTNSSIPTYPIQRFQRRWDSLNAKNGWPWESNPWIWVIQFKRLETQNEHSN